MNKLSRTLLLFTLIFFLGCANKNEKNKFKNHKKIVVLDSLKVTGTNLNFDHYYHHKILFHNPVNFSVYIYDILNNQTSVFNNFGNNYDKHGYILNNINFYNDSVIAIGKSKSINLYKINGKFIKRLPVKRDVKSYAPLSNIHFINDTLLIYKESIGNFGTNDINFYKQKGFIGRFYNINKGVYNKFGKFPEKVSVYNDQMYFYNYPFMFNFRLTSGYINVLSWNDPIIYQYDLKTGKLVNYKKLRLLYYKPFKIKFSNNKNMSISKIISSNYQNSEMYNFDIHKDTSYIAYNIGFTKDKVLEAMENKLKKTNCLHIVTNNGKILFDDKLPEKLGKFIFAENGLLYFLGKDNQKSEDDNLSIVYKAKLVDK